MKYNLMQTIDDYNSGEDMEFLFFWGHHPRKDGEVNHSCFSQWYDSKFTVDDAQFKTAEHWMMAEKANLFSDLGIIDEILNSKTPKDAKALGRKIKNFDNKLWNDNKYEIVKQGNLHKFVEYEDLKEFLIGTGDKVLVEASPYDKIWGIGLSKDDEDSSDPNLWRGENLLGFALMEVRDELR